MSAIGAGLTTAGDAFAGPGDDWARTAAIPPTVETSTATTIKIGRGLGMTRHSSSARRFPQGHFALRDSSSHFEIGIALLKMRPPVPSMMEATLYFPSALVNNGPPELPRCVSQSFNHMPASRSD